MFGKQDIEKALGVVIVRNEELEHEQELWRKMLEGKAEWNSKEVPSIGLAKSVVRELTDVCIFESKCAVTGNDPLNVHVQKAWKQKRDVFSGALGQGGVILKPYVRGSRIMLTVVTPDCFAPLKYNDLDELISAVFVGRKQEGDKHFILFEIHEWLETRREHIIRHYAFKSGESGNIGARVPVEQVIEGLQPEIVLSNFDVPAFVPCNMPRQRAVFADAIDLFRLVDEQNGRYVWEYEGGELAIDASIDLFRKTGHLNPDGTPEVALPKGKERLYRNYDAGVKSLEGKDPMKAWSPELRDESIQRGENEFKRKIEFNMGLAYGTISDPQERDRTATEVEGSKQRTMLRSADIQAIVEEAYTSLVKVMSLLGARHNLFPEKEYAFSISWGDGIFENREATNQVMLKQVAAGLLKPEIYIAWWNGIDYDGDELNPANSEVLKKIRNLMPSAPAETAIE